MYEFLYFIVIGIFLLSVRLREKPFKNKYINKIKEYFTNWHLGLATSTKYKSANIFITFILPLILIWLVMGKTITRDTNPIWFSFLYTIVLMPFLEEIITRGGLFGFFFKVAERAKSEGKYFESVIKILGLLVQTFVFGWLHILTGYSATLLGSFFTTGLIFGLLFWVSERSIIPSAIAHIGLNSVMFYCSFLVNTCHYA